MNDTLTVTGRLKCVLTDPDGSVVETKYHNMVLNTGRLVIAQFLCNQNPSGVTHMAVGTDSSAPAYTQTGLVSEVFRKQLNSAITSTVGNTAKAIFDCVFGAGEGVGVLREACILNAEGTAISRALINVEKGIYQQLTVSWELTIA